MNMSWRAFAWGSQTHRSAVLCTDQPEREAQSMYRLSHVPFRRGAATAHRPLMVISSWSVAESDDMTVLI